MPDTKLRDTIDIAKDAIYSVWEKNLTLEDISNTQPKIELFQYYSAITPTSLSIDPGRISKTAEIWNVLNRNITTLISGTRIGGTGLSATQQCISAVPSSLPFLDLDKETIVFCNQRNILDDATIYYKLICKTFKNIKGIKINLQSDYEIDNLKMVRFDVKIHGEIDTILEEEDEFIGKICELISKESRAYFVLTTQIV